MIRLGQNSSEVAAVQLALNAVTPFMPKLKPDGMFGPRTLERVKQHQAARSLVPDGIVGPLTFESLFQFVKADVSVSYRRKPDGGVAGLGGFKPPLIPVPKLKIDPPFMPFSTEFLEWWLSPSPKPSIPAPPSGGYSVPSAWGPMFFPSAPQRIVLPPSAGTSRIRLESPPEGKMWTIEAGVETTFDPKKRGFKTAEYKLSVEWMMFKRPLVQIGLQGGLIRNDDGKLVVEAEAKVSAGDSNPLKRKFGNDWLFKVAPYAAVAVSSELAANAKVGTKAAIEFSRLDPLKLSVAAELFTKVQLGPKEMPDGSHQYVLKGGSGLALAISAGFEF